MRSARLSALTALVLSVTGALPLVSAAHAAATDLYVDNGSASCSDTPAAAGSQSRPFCTISAAAAVVQPGQTVRISNRAYHEDVHLTRSGTPDAPIRFTRFGPPPDRFTAQTEVTGTAHAFELDGVHDVTVDLITARAGQEAVLVTGSSRVTVDSFQVYSSGWSSTADTRYPALRIGGGSKDVTVSRSLVTSSRGDGVTVEAGTAGTVITTNEIVGNQGRGVSVTDAPGTVVVSNSIGQDCGSGIELAGNSSGASVENNELGEASDTSGPWGACGPDERVDLAVSAASAAGTTADYNVVATGLASPYRWGGRVYPDPASFRQGSGGRGAHDLQAASTQMRGTAQDSPSIDSADADAPGELATDAAGRPRIDDPNIADTGTGAGHYDRGAFEVQDKMTVQVSAVPSTAAGRPLDATITGGVTQLWGKTSVLVDFGDGSAPVASPAFPLAHTYPGPGTYTVTLTGTDAVVGTRQATAKVTIQPIGPIKATLTLGRPNAAPMSVFADISWTASPWPTTKETIDFGDGTAVDADRSANGNDHDYAVPGSYTVTHTVADDHGRSDTVSRTITVGSDYQPLRSPVRVLDTRSGLGAAAAPVGPGGVLKLQVTGRAGVPANGRVTAVLLNLTATGSTQDTFITAFPGGPVPGASNLNAAPGRDVGNAVVVPVAPDGTVSLFNHVGRVDLVADVQGYYTTQPDDAGRGIGTLAAPVRVLDTRSGTGGIGRPVGPGETIRVPVRGAAPVMSVSDVAIINLTATDGTQNSYVTAAPDGNPPSTSSLNFSAGQTVANQVTVPINADGTVTLYNHTGSVNLIADVQGYYSAMAGTPLVSTAPTRVLDTRNGTGGGRRLGPDSSVRVKVAGVAGLPDHPLSVVVNLTATDPTETGWLNAYASGSPVAGTSNINVTPGATVPNLAVVPVGPDGCIEIHNHSGWTDVVVDLQGYTA
ncbi:PKD domain-containing protein [Kitasatospora cineracea]|uniref:PKD domain-containing protein n=1 Tax=Kitasatospora cineracea TaxID=88074 RepID=UPI0033DC9C2A